jgi:hypothetical protein
MVVEVCNCIPFSALLFVMHKPAKEVLTIIAGGTFTVCIWCVACFFQLLVANLSPAMIDCGDFPKQLLCMGTTLCVEVTLLALALYFTLQFVFGILGRMTGVYTVLFILASCLSAVWWVRFYYQNNGC